ncbi:hypothetical protein TRVL_03872 [Trypanosoma vivax]|nr:hypothetical protein TRVL_03872 [Trypanosoma vivax]
MLGRSAVRRIFERTCGVDFLRNRFTNKSTAFTRAEREHLGLVGLLPPTEETLEEQAKRCWEQIKLTNDPISKYRALQEVLSDNVTLYYKVVNANLTDVLPLIYTPTVGEVCERYSNLFTRDQALYLSCKERGTVRQAIKNLHQSDVDIIVVTDGSRILGLGDLGVNGVGISIGKCSLYVAAGGIHPGRALPVVLDVGTNTKRLLEDPMYIGLRSPRASDEDFYALLDEFMDAAREEWPNAVVQFEDFSTNHCFDMLDRYQNKYRCFNDDIQGTGAVIAAGFLNAIHASGLPIEDHRIVVFGAGSAAVGVAQFIVDLVARTYKKTTEEVRKAVYLIDTKGLVTTTRGDTLAAHKVSWARTDITAEQSNSLRTLLDVVKFVKPTALIGLGAQGGVFTEDVVRLMASNCKRPVLFPLSNPSSKAEIIPEDAYKWTDGAAIVASGSPFPPCVLNGKQLPHRRATTCMCSLVLALAAHWLNPLTSHTRRLLLQRLPSVKWWTVRLLSLRVSCIHQSKVLVRCQRTWQLPLLRSFSSWVSQKKTCLAGGRLLLTLYREKCGNPSTWNRIFISRDVSTRHYSFTE